MKRPIGVAFGALFVALSTVGARSAPDPGLQLLPRPASITAPAQCALALTGSLTVPRNVDEGAREIVNERWTALGIPPLRAADRSAKVTVAIAGGAPESYRLNVDTKGVRIDAADGDGAFYAFMTLAQLARRTTPGRFMLPCVQVSDAPALRWRILSDDVSRGPLPTMRYFRERIRTIAAFKMNGYSPYMEHVFVDPSQPLAAPRDGITAAELKELNAYARRFHVALIPEQQTFAHMHGTLSWERFEPLAELPHGYLLTPANPGGEAYVRELMDAELQAVPHPPFFHIGSDEPLDLGRGASRRLVQSRGLSDVFLQHVLDTIALVSPSGARPMLWDDAVQANPGLFAKLPKSLVFINWHYGAEPTFVPYIRKIADAGFEQMVAPGADNWNEIYPDIATALANIDRFTSEGKSAHVLGLFQTVWHDDGETLYESTWFPVIYAATSAWESDSVERMRFTRDFGWTFFGSNDPRYQQDVDNLIRARALLRPAGESDAGNYLFWADPLDPLVFARMAHVDLVALRLAAESVIENERLTGAPPLHRAAAAAMRLAARRYDTLGRAFQVGTEARTYYDDARANVGKSEDVVHRGLNVAKYSFWELRDAYLGLVPLVAAAWEYESRTGHEPSVLERYHLSAERAIERADAINRTTVEVYDRTHVLPPFDSVVKP